MESQHPDAIALLQQAALNAHRAKQTAVRTLAVVAGVTLIVGILVGVAITRQLEQGRAAETRYENVTRELNADVVPVPPVTSESALDRQALISTLTGHRRDAVTLALQLYDQHIPFKWGGKTPEDGLDTSGYVAYVL